ncbi:hypothetical protein IscW_ISCW013613, partial [Ixodes scapularis]
KNYFVHHLDDVLVATTTWKEHVQKLQQAFHGFREEHLAIKSQKCEVRVAFITFLGHSLGDGK